MRRFAAKLVAGLALAALATTPQAGNLDEAPATTTPAGKLGEALAAADGDWLAFDVPVSPGTRSPCCWQGRWNSLGPRQCRLDERISIHGTGDDSAETDRLHLYVQVRDDEVRRLLPVGPDCPVEAGDQRVAALAQVEPETVAGWLDALAREHDEDIGHQAVYVLSLMPGETVTARLTALARLPGEWPARDALLWLAESRPQEARPLLLQMLEEDPSRQRVEMIVFSISQMGDGSGDALLFDLASDPARADELRKQAFFWLAQSDDEATLDRLVALLTDQ